MCLGHVNRSTHPSVAAPLFVSILSSCVPAGTSVTSTSICVSVHEATVAATLPRTTLPAVDVNEDPAMVSRPPARKV